MKSGILGVAMMSVMSLCVVIMMFYIDFSYSYHQTRYLIKQSMRLSVHEAQGVENQEQLFQRFLDNFNAVALRGLRYEVSLMGFHQGPALLSLQVSVHAERLIPYRFLIDETLIEEAGDEI